MAKAQVISWDHATPAPIVLLSGTFDATAYRALDRIKRRLRLDTEALEFIEASASDYRRGMLTDWSTPSLFAEPKCIIVRDLESMNDAFVADALDLAKAPRDPDITIILRHAGGQRGKKVLTELRKQADVVEIVNTEPKRMSDKQAFISSLFAYNGRSVHFETAQALLEIFAESLGEIPGAVDQLCDDVEGDISASDVTRFFGGRIETTGFQVADAAIAGQTASAVLLLRQALASGVPEIMILGAMTKKIRLMSKVADTGNAPAASLAGTIGAAPWQIDRARKDLRGWDDTKLVRAHRALAATDEAVKGGSRNAAYAMEQLVIFIGS